MYSLSHAVTPAFRSHLDAQASFFSEISKTLSHSFQNLFELNFQLSQTMLDEGNSVGQQLLTTDSATDAVAIAAAHAQPVAEKLRTYQQHITRVVADTQIELARVTEQHSQLTSRTARELADQVAQVATEAVEKSASGSVVADDAGSSTSLQGDEQDALPHQKSGSKGGAKPG